jgi:hypothetical protein
MESEERGVETDIDEKEEQRPGFLHSEFDDAIAGICRDPAGSTFVIYDVSQLYIHCYDRGMSGDEAQIAINNAFACCRASTPMLMQRMTPSEVRQLAFKLPEDEGGEDGHQDRPQPSE